jgi:hypothetical protein
MGLHLAMPEPTFLFFFLPAESQLVSELFSTSSLLLIHSVKALLIFLYIGQFFKLLLAYKPFV